MSHWTSVEECRRMQTSVEKLLDECRQIQASVDRFQDNWSRGKLAPDPNSNTNPKPNPKRRGNFPRGPLSGHYVDKCGQV